MKKPRIIALFAIAALLCLTSCSALTGAITGQPIPSTPVQRAGDPSAPSILVSSADLAQAEAAPAGTVHGLYDAGYLANRAREVVTGATK